MSQTYIDFGFVKENASFEPILAHYNLKLVGAGAQRSVLCPFHRERKPSCKIELERRIFHCFGCEAKGNVLEFVAKLDDSDLRTAALKIAELGGIATAPPRGEARTAVKERPGERRRPNGIAPASAKPAGRAPEVAASESVNPPLTFQLKLEAEHPYLAERGLSNEQIALFGLGFCSRGSMGGRICVPIHNEQGQLVAYAGRWPGDDVPDGQERYRLPSKFEKNRVLFNLHRATLGEHIVLVEGYWSAIRLHTLGVPVAALMGSSVSTEQLALLRERGYRFLTLLWDGDEPGRKARERALPDLASAFFVRAALLPDGEKPDTLAEPTLRGLVCWS
jgi:DNA primase